MPETKDILLGCKGGNHSLIDILQARHPWDGSHQVARWCQVCGSIVVDIDFDGRTHPGQVMEMMQPETFSLALQK